METATGKEAGGTTRLNELLGYKYDAAGNLNRRTYGNPSSANYLAQTLNVDSGNPLNISQLVSDRSEGSTFRGGESFQRDCTWASVLVTETQIGVRAEDGARS